MIGVILCGGLGTRLRETVPHLPKALAPVNGKPFLQYQIEAMGSYGIRDIVLCAGYRWEDIHAQFGDGHRYGVQLHYSVEKEPLGTAGCLKYAQHLLADTLLVLNGDTFIQLDPKGMLEHHRKRNSLVTVAVAKVSNAGDYGSVALNDVGSISSFQEKRAGIGYVNAGAYVMEPSVLSYLAPDRQASLEHDLLPLLLREGQSVSGYEISGSFLDIGTPDRYQRAQEGW